MSWLNGHKELDTTERWNNKGETEGREGKSSGHREQLPQGYDCSLCPWALSIMQVGNSFSSECCGA